MMRLVAVELIFDSEAARRLADLQDELAEIYGGPKIAELRVQPHLSLSLSRRARRTSCAMSWKGWRGVSILFPFGWVRWTASPP